MKNFGVGGNYYHSYTITSQIENQRLKVGSCRSPHSSCISGIAQLSILGPLLFLVYVNDLLYALEGRETSRYADDFETVLISLQNEKQKLSDIGTWSSKKIQLNLSKKKSPLHEANDGGRRQQSQMKNTSVQKDLGVLQAVMD